MGYMHLDDEDRARIWDPHAADHNTNVEYVGGDISRLEGARRDRGHHGRRLRSVSGLTAGPDPVGVALESTSDLAHPSPNAVGASRRVTQSASVIRFMSRRYGTGTDPNATDLAASRRAPMVNSACSMPAGSSFIHRSRRIPPSSWPRGTQPKGGRSGHTTGARLSDVVKSGRCGSVWDPTRDAVSSTQHVADACSCDIQRR
jgi:hypothetical protein